VKVSENKILVVDDQPNWQEAFKSILETIGYKVDIAETLNDAILKLSSISYLLLIVDVRLDDENPFDIGGLELVARTKSIFKNKKKPKVIAVTGFPNEVYENLLLKKLKVDCFMYKSPSAGFNVSHFKQKVDHLISK
jgi:DNA-binding response OmpR family regulator